MGRIDDCAEEYRLWCSGLGIQSAEDVNRVIENGRIHELINVSEARHSQKLSEIADTICKKGRRIIFIAGPSSSGKTTTARKLQLHMTELGINAVPVSLDDYYIEHKDMPKNDEGKPDFEALESIDYKRFNENLAELAAGHKAVMPGYDFMMKRVIPEARTLKLAENELIIVEGIHGLNPKLAENIPNNGKFRIYCSALSVLKDKNGERIPSHIKRMVRRLVRDYYFRAADYRTTLNLWPNQERSAEKNIFPYTETADVIFNSSLPYEFCVYRNHLLKVLEDADDGEYGGDIRCLREIAKNFEPVDVSAVPGTSLVREFVGGSTLD